MSDVTDPIMESLSSDDSEVTLAEETKEEAPEAEVVEAQPEVEQTEGETESEVEEEVKEVEEPSQEVEEDVKTEEESPQEVEVDPKEEARRRYEERQAVQNERKRRVQEQTESYVNEAEDETEQRLRTIESQEYSRIIENTENSLISEFERAKVNPDLQMFNPESEEFNQMAYNKAIKDYNNGYIQYDQNGNMVGLKGSLFEHLKETAELYGGAVKSGAFQQVRATRKMKSNADSKPAAVPSEKRKDSIMDVLTSED